MKSLCFAILLAAAPMVFAQDAYRVELAGSLDGISVRACFEGAPPERLYHHPEAARFGSVIALPDGGALRLRMGRGSTPLPSTGEGACMAWRVDLAAAVAGGGERQRFAMRVGEDVVTDADVWFWRGPGERRVRVEFTAPPGVGISVPWRLLGGTDGTSVFEPEATPATWAARTAFGRFAVQRLVVPGATLRLAIPGSASGRQRDMLAAWIAQAARAVGNVYGRYPQSSPQVLVIPVGRRGEPVPWAHVLRGGGVGAEFFVDETRSLEELAGDWTACHELSHMLLPFVSRGDRWLSEGLASYYQYVLLARSGRLSEREAWQGLFDGFHRGRRDTNGLTLQEATARGWEHTMRVYWSGAAIMLLADTRLRALSGGGQSLDGALAALGACCLDESRRWRALSLFRRLDRITGTRVFAELYRDYVDGRSFPDLAETWRALGVESRRNRVRLSDDAPMAGLRAAIMQPGTPP